MGESLNRRLVIRLLGTSAALSLSAHPAWAAPTPARRKPERPVVVIDPGHGGHDPGAIGVHGTQEKTITLDIARRVAALLERRGLSAPLTRSGDRYLDLDERAAVGVARKARLFLSIHADSAPNKQARGLSAYTLSEDASDALADALAQRENRAGALGREAPKGAQRVVRDILLDLTSRNVRHASLVAREALVSAAGRKLKLLDNPMRAANFAVLRSPGIPSVLVETGFLSNAEDEKALRSANVRQTVAEVLAAEIGSLVLRPPFV
jgi:N-acetylmuramoyl-L-alanine amidase